jgi:predicted component of type VI protein secretion system
MIKTGKFNPLGDEILQIEESDINFWNTKWDDLELEQKADFVLSLKHLFLVNKTKNQ